MIIFYLLFILTFSIRGTISYLESYQQPSTSSRSLIAGEYHDADPAGQRQILKHALHNFAQHSCRPLTVYLEDPLAIPGLETLCPPHGLLLGLTAELQQMALPARIQIKNFDTKMVANCAIHFFSQKKPILNPQLSAINALTFGHLITELEKSVYTYENHHTLERLAHPAQKDCVAQLAQIKASIALLQKNLTELRIGPGDSIAGTAVAIASKSEQQDWFLSSKERNKVYQPHYTADVGLTSLAAIITILESKNDTALLCGERHAKDVSRILEHEQWTDLKGPCSFSSSLLLNRNGC